MNKLFNFLNKAVKEVQKFEQNPNLPRNLGFAKTITIDKMPSSTEEFIQLRNQFATTPEGAAAIFLLASIKLVENNQMGRHWVIIATDKNGLSPSQSELAYKGFDLAHSANFSINQIKDKKYIPYSYVKGSSLSNGYEVGNPPYTFQIERSTDGGDGTVKVYVQSSGVDTARPITCKKNDAGVWKAFEYSSIFTGIKTPILKSRGAEDGDF